MDINTNHLKQYWESYEMRRWDQIESQDTDASHLHFNFNRWTNVTEIILEVTLCLLVALLIVILYFCMRKKSKRCIDDSEKTLSGPPTYDDVIKKERDELENLPSYLDALKIEDEMKCKSWLLNQSSKLNAFNYEAVTFSLFFLRNSCV